MNCLEAKAKRKDKQEGGMYMQSVFENKSECCGCSACQSICPVFAIKMVQDEKGFFYPHIEQSLCVDCKMCMSVCDFSHPQKVQNDTLQFFGLIHKDKTVQKESQSGGAFTLLSDAMLKDGGIVYGVVLDKKDLSCHYARATTTKERDAMRGSKYVQASMNGVFLQVKNDLSQNKKVLFSGTPCLVAGLFSFIQKTNAQNKENLILVDLICHGVPSQKMFKSYINYCQKKYRSPIVWFNFREQKRHKWGDYIEEITLQNGKKKTADWYANLFFNDASLKESCHNCKYCMPQRNSDFSIADFWGISSSVPSLYDRHGVSFVIVHTQKARKLFSCIRDGAVWQEVKQEDSIQIHLKEPVKKPKDYEDFWKDYFCFAENDFEKFLKKHSTNSLCFQKRMQKAFSFLLHLPYRAARKAMKTIKYFFKMNTQVKQGKCRYI